MHRRRRSGTILPGLCLAIGLIALPSSAHGQARENRWLNLVDDENVTITIDTTSVQRLGARQFRGWFRWFWKKEQELRPGNVFWGTVTMANLDCEGRRLKSGTVIYYSINGDVAESERAQGDWQPVTPDSLGEAMLDAACEYFAKRRAP